MFVYMHTDFNEEEKLNYCNSHLGDSYDFGNLNIL